MRGRGAFVLVLCWIAFVTIGCGYGSSGIDGSGDTATPSPAPSFGVGTVIIDKGSDTVLVHVRVAQTARQRRFGLMFRKSLPEGSGMVFIYFEPTRGGYWMKDTTIPLSIAFFDRDGRILHIMDMKPCRSDPCKVYDPGVSFSGALEVNRGAFARWGVRAGDRIHIAQ